MNDMTPLTFGEIKSMLGGILIAFSLWVGGSFIKEWLIDLVRSKRAKKNGKNGRAAIAKNGDFQALINAQHDTKDAVENGFKDLAKVLTTGFDRIAMKLIEVKGDTDATRKVVEVVDDDLAHRVHNKPAVEKLIRKIASKLGIGGSV